MRVAIIGAGCSGLAAIKNLIQAGIREIVCFEQNDRIGGNWIYSPEPSHSSVCETTHIISSKKRSEYTDFPMPDSYPDYPSHSQVLDYFDSYADRFGLLPFIRFRHKVDKVIKTKEGLWEVFTNDRTVPDIFDYLLVSNGHHSVPRHYKIPGHYTGEYMHSHDFKNNKGFEGKRVLIVGGGNSACDCAVECSRVSEHVVISMRRPHYIIPKFFLGKPVDTFNDKLNGLPAIVAERLRKLSLKIQLGKYEDYGLQTPDFPVTSDHPTVNSELLYMLRHGKVIPKNGIKFAEAKSVTFEDGTTDHFDIIIAATGYKIATPFFDPDFLDYSEADQINLFLRMFHPTHKNLIFIGLVQPQGAIWPLADIQSKLAANLIIGNWNLPDNVEKLAIKEATEISKNFLKEKRHVIEVHFREYFDKIKSKIPSDAPAWDDYRVLADAAS
ncbi:MAG: NAD(P)-binding domain-containing protein [Saprospiraceae bacterium]|nr:NAD(P)-binding domain-containing protein [Saprospiraceae bacterium]